MIAQADALTSNTRAAEIADILSGPDEARPRVNLTVIDVRLPWGEMMVVVPTSKWGAVTTPGPASS